VELTLDLPKKLIKSLDDLGDELDLDSEDVAKDLIEHCLDNPSVLDEIYPEEDEDEGASLDPDSEEEEEPEEEDSEA